MPSERVRPPAVAGRFYPADPQQLADDVRQYLNAAQFPDDCLAPPLVIEAHELDTFVAALPGLLDAALAGDPP